MAPRTRPRSPAPKRLALPKRFSAAMTEPAYRRLRELNDQYGLGNNYLLTVLLERLDDFAEPDALDAAFRAFIDEYGAPAAASEDPKTTPAAQPSPGDTEEP